MSISTPLYILGTNLDLGISGWLPTVWKYEAGVATKVHEDNVNFNNSVWGSYSTGFATANFVVVSSGPTSASGFDRAAAYAVGGVWTNLVPPAASKSITGIYGTNPTNIYVVGTIDGGIGFDNIAAWKWDGVGWTLIPMPITVRAGGRRVGIYSFEPGKFFIYAEVGIPPNVVAVFQGRILFFDGTTLSDLGGPGGNLVASPGIGALAWKMLSPTQALHLTTISGVPGTHFILSWDGAIWTPTAGVPAVFTSPFYFLDGVSFDALYGSNGADVYRVNRSANSIASVYAPAATGGLIEQVRRDPNSGDLATIRSDGVFPRDYYLDSSPDGVAWGGVAVPGVGNSQLTTIDGLIFEDTAPPPPSPPTPSGPSERTNALKIYPFVIQSIRDADEADGDLLLKRWTEGMDEQWAVTWSKIRSLATLIDPETCPSDAVAFLGWIVGLTKELEGLTGGISESDYRQLIAIAVRMWKKKGSGLGLVETLSSISGYDVRYLTWFFFRIILGEFELGHAEFDVDPWLLDQPGMSPGVAPDALVVERILRGTVLPSAADPIWTYANEGAIEGATFSIFGGKISETQSSAAGGRYQRDDVAGLFDPEAAEVGAIFRIDAKISVGGTPWFLELEDGVRGYRLRISDGVAVLQDAAGNAIESRSRGFSVGVDYALRIARTGPTTVDVTIDGASVFGEREISEFAASANKRYGFGYRSEADPSNDWTVSWREVGPRPVLKFDLSTLLGLTEAVPHDVRVVYRENAGRTSPSFWTGSRNEVSISDAFGVSIPLDLELANFRVGVDPDEFVSDLRVVDDGTLDRVFVANLVGVLRPSGERVFVRFVDFQDLFQNRDLRYWTLESGTATPRPDDGRLDLEDGAVATVVHADMPLASVWRQFTAAAQYSLRDEVAGKWGELRFHVQDDLNFYAVRFDPGVRTVALQKVVAGARSTIFTHGPMPVFYPGVLYMTHVTTEDVVGGVLIKVYLDGNYLGESIEADFDEGTLGLAVELGQRLSVSFADLVVCPFSSARVGPGIDASPTWSDDCANP